MKIRIYISVSLLSRVLCVREHLPTRLPDLIEDAETYSISKTIPRPKLNPTVTQIETEEFRDGVFRQRLHYFISALLLMYVATVLVGSVTLATGELVHRRLQDAKRAKESTDTPTESTEVLKENAHMPKACTETPKESTETPKRPLSIKQEQLVTQLVCAMAIGVCLSAVIFSLDAKCLSKDVGLNWEVYLVLFGSQCLWFLVQAVVKACIETGSLPFYTFLRCSVALIPLFGRNDACDILKEMILGALLLQSDHIGAKLFGLLAWAHVIVLRAYLCATGWDSLNLEKGFRV